MPLFLNQSFLSGHLDYFLILIIANNAATNLPTYLSFGIHVRISADKYLGVGLLGQVAILFFHFWRMSILFSISAASVCSLINSTRGFPFLHLFPNTCCLLTQWWYSFWQCEMVAHCAFNLHCSDNECHWVSFPMSLGHLYDHFGEKPMQVHIQFFHSLFFMYFGYQPFIRCIIVKYLLPFIWLCFHFVDGFL